MADGRHIKIVKAPFLNNKLFDSDEIWFAEANSNTDDNFIKIQNFRNSIQLTSVIFKVVFWP